MNYKKAYKFFQEDLKDIIRHCSMLGGFDDQITESVAKRLLFQTKIYEEQIDKEVELTDYKLKGWDWSELSDKFGLKNYDPPGDEWGWVCVDDNLEFNKVYHYIRDNFENKKVIKTIKEYLRKMIRDEGTPDHYDAVWQGMLNIEDDIVFMQFVLAFLGHMWT